MSNLLLNLRVWCIHFQIARDISFPRYGLRKDEVWFLWFRISFNRLHLRNTRIVELM